MIDTLKPLRDDVPIFIEMGQIIQKFFFEVDGQAADYVDAFLLNSHDAEVHFNQFVELELEPVFGGELGEGEDAGVDDGDDLGEDYLLVCNAAVGRFGIERY